MKKQIKLVLILATLCSLNACNSGSSSNETKASSPTSTVMADSTKINMPMEDGMMSPMTSMTKKMNSMKMSGDFDDDFAALMIEHHQGAVAVSKMEVAKGMDEQMKKMAQTMVADHQSEIEQLKAFISHHDSEPEHTDKNAIPKHENVNESALTNIMKMEEMNSMKMTGNMDKDYAMMMKAHHENAMKMSQAEIANGHHADLKKMAQKMSNDDMKEIKEFDTYLTSKK